MASRHADSSRYDDRSRGYERDRRRERDDRRDRRYPDDRYDDRRARDQHDSYSSRRRSRSPRRRDRSRDRTRYRDDRGGKRDHYDDRDYRDRDRDRDAHRERDRRRGSASATPGVDDLKRTPRERSTDRSPRDAKTKRAQGQPQDKEPVKKDKLARLEEWKKKQLEKKSKQQAETLGTGQSPAVTAPATPAASTPPTCEVAQEPVKAKISTNGIAEKAEQKQKPAIKLDESAKSKPLQGKTAGKPVSSVEVKNRVAAPLKATGNISSFGLKAKTTEEARADKSVLLDDEDKTQKRTLQQLPDFVPEDQPSPSAEDIGTPEDIGSDDEETNAQLQAQLEKRRAEMTNEDTSMEDAPVVPDAAGEAMHLDDAEEDDVDPLDAFMAGLTEAPANARAPPGEAMYEDEQVPDDVPVDPKDEFEKALAKKKKKEVPKIQHDKIDYPPFRKKFYTEPLEVGEMSAEEVADLRLELDGIKVKPENVPRPVTKWAQMGLLQPTMNALQQVGYAKPTSIQSQAIPIAESGHDMIGVAKTGSGKTLAFGLPVIRHILDQPPLKSTDGPIVLIIAPTRELSVQIVNELRPFLKASNLNIVCAFGGPPISTQIALIKRGGIHVLCATPGRLLDLLQSNSGRVLSFKRITYVVLDEADRMFDMGFEPQVMKIIENVRPDRQTILFSATMPKNMASAARKILKDPSEVIIGGRSTVAAEITQLVEVLTPDKKMEKLLWYLGKFFDENEHKNDEDSDVRALIFVERQETAEDLLSKVMKRGYPCNTIHGGKDQHDRTDAINDFKNGVIPLLIATSVAARGLDILQLKLVINYDCPTHLEDYVHRCGRTGRAGNKGTAVTLIETPGQERFAVHIAKALKQSGQEVPEEVKAMAKEFSEKVKAGTEKWYGAGFGGKGLDKLDKARQVLKKREKRAHKADLDDGSDSEPEVLPTITMNGVAAPGADSAAAAATADDPNEPSYMKALKNIVVNRTERPSNDTSNMSAFERARAAATGIDGRLSKKNTIHHGQPIDNKGPDAGLYHSTLEINDFPQKARWGVTNRTNVAKILDATGTSITTKGTFYPAGKAPTLESDLPKLYILVEGDTDTQVYRAVQSLMDLLKDGTLAAEDSGPRGATGRYHVNV